MRCVPVPGEALLPLSERALGRPTAQKAGSPSGRSGELVFLSGMSSGRAEASSHYGSSPSVTIPVAGGTRLPSQWRTRREPVRKNDTGTRSVAPAPFSVRRASIQRGSSEALRHDIDAAPLVATGEADSGKRFLRRLVRGRNRRIFESTLAGVEDRLDDLELLGELGANAASSSTASSPDPVSTPTWTRSFTTRLRWGRARRRRRRQPRSLPPRTRP